MHFKQLSIITVLGICCFTYCQDQILADALASQGELKLQQAKTPEDYKAVFDLLKKAAESGSQKGNLYLGKLYFEGKGVAVNRKKAVECWELADKKSKQFPEGMAEAKYLLGLELFQRAKRTNDENGRMESLLEKAGETGIADAWAILGKIYWNGSDFFAKNPEWSRKYFLQAELMKPSGEYEYWIGCTYAYRDILKKRDLVSAFYWLELAAKKNYLPAHAKLGLLYLQDKNFDKAEFHLGKAIPLKNLEAITALNAYRVFNYEKKYKKLSPGAQKIIQSWLTRARSGDPVAAYTLGQYFLLRSTWKSGIKFDNASHGFFFLQYAAGLGSKEAEKLSRSISVPALKSAKESDFAKWHTKSGNEVVKAFSDIYGASLKDGILNKPDYALDFIRDLQQTATLAGFFWLQDHILFQDTGKIFSAVGTRISPKNGLEYFLFRLDGQSDFHLKYLGDGTKLLYGWNDAGYYMAAYKNKDGKIVITGIPLSDTTGTYPGNDHPNDNFYGKYGRAGFKPEQDAQVETFLPNLKKLLKENKKEEIADLIKYPFTLNEETPLEETIKDKQEFLNRFDEIFPEKLKTALLNTPNDEIFSTWMGVGIGNGLLWFKPGEAAQSGKILITGIDRHIFHMPAIFKGEKKPQNDSELFEAADKNPLRLKNLLPPGVKTIAAIAPGYYPGQPLHRDGIKLFREAGYKVKVMPHAFVRTNEKAQAPLAGRVEDFCNAWNDPEVDMILCIRGGFGTVDVIEKVDWSKLKKRPELYVQGFSDITMLTCMLFHKGYGHPVAGPNFGTIAGMTADSIEAMRASYSGAPIGPIKLETLVPGDCQGKPLPGLLHRLMLLSGKEYCPDAKGRIVFMEEVGSSPEAVKRNLDELLKKKFFDGAAGIVFCQFARCKDPKKIDTLLREYAPKFGMPVYKGFPFGHTSRIYCIDFARPVEIRNGELLFPAVKQ